MNALAYTRFELLRTFRNRRFFILSLAFPLLLYCLIVGPQRHSHVGTTGISVPLYFMVGMISFGTMSGMLSSGARIAAERAVGWNRQLRISPLSTRAYLRAKVLTSYMMALLTMAVLYVAGAAFGVSLSAGEWLHMTVLILISLIPFAALGIAIGHMLTPDSTGPAVGGGVGVLAFLGGTWFPIPHSGFLHDVAQILPSYWLVQASHVVFSGQAWPTKAWIVLAAWTAVLALLARRAYRHDTGRV
jgi:ABC-2 type transport system permease protein